MAKFLMSARPLWTQLGVVGTMLLIVAIACLLPLEASANVLTCLFFFAFGVCLLSFVRDPRDRANLIKIFVAAYALRVLFTALIHGFGLNTAITSGDEDGWNGSWWISRFWRGYESAPPNIGDVPGLRPPQTFEEIMSGDYGHNKGWYHFTAYFFFLLDVRSQLALTFINCFFNSLTACIIYRIAKGYYSEKAALFASSAAVIFPGYLAWSSQTIKEPWVIFLEILAFYFTWLALRDRSLLMVFLATCAVLVTYSMRFYVAYVIVLAMIFATMAWHSKRPKVAACRAACALVVVYFMASGLGILTIDVVGIITDNMEAFTSFRQNVSGFGARGTSVDYGTGSGVYLDYDPSTPFGLVMLLVTGGTYLLLSPFPWALSGKQIFALPDVALWWVLVFGFIIPGIRSAWKHQPALAVTLLSYLVPLIVLYSLLFGNVGLAYRQRAQLMPFFLIFAAAGYDARRKKKEVSQVSKSQLLARLRAIAVASSQSPNAHNTPPGATLSGYAVAPVRRPEN